MLLLKCQKVVMKADRLTYIDLKTFILAVYLLQDIDK